MDMIPKTQATLAKIDKWYYVKLKSFLTEKETINRVKGQQIKQKKTLANYISNKRLIFKICKKLPQCNSKKLMSQVKNGWRTCIDNSPKKTYSTVLKPLISVANQVTAASSMAALEAADAPGRSDPGTSGPGCPLAMGSVPGVSISPYLPARAQTPIFLKRQGVWAMPLALGSLGYHRQEKRGHVDTFSSQSPVSNLSWLWKPS